MSAIKGPPSLTDARTRGGGGELLARGEDAHLEYRSTFRWDLRAAAVSKVMETAVLKTVAAFLNSREGGTLLVGVADDGRVLGLESDLPDAAQGRQRRRRPVSARADPGGAQPRSERQRRRT